MPDWTKSMQRTYEYYLVDPLSWCDKSRITCVKSSTIERDSSEATNGHATLEVTESLNECYVRIYMVVIQKGVTEKFPLATVLAQTPGNDFDGKIAIMSVDAYMPLVELKETLPPYGFTVMKNANIMENACKNIQEHMRAPLIITESKKTLVENFVSNTDDTWLSFNSDLIAKADFSFSTDEMGTVTFSPKRELEAMQPVVTFGDDEHSILQPSISTEYDLYGVPNVVEVIYSGDNQFFKSRIENNDPTSITSTVNRGREILYRDTNPNITGTVSQSMETWNNIAFRNAYLLAQNTICIGAGSTDPTSDKLASMLTVRKDRINEINADVTDTEGHAYMNIRGGKASVYSDDNAGWSSVNVIANKDTSQVELHTNGSNGYKKLINYSHGLYYYDNSTLLAAYNGNTPCLWDGGAWMFASQSVTLSAPISEQPHGILVIFALFDPTTNSLTNVMTNPFFVPKTAINYDYVFTMFWENAWQMCTKRVTIQNTCIIGNDQNKSAAFKANTGITTSPQYFVLRRVYGV